MLKAENREQGKQVMNNNASHTEPKYEVFEYKGFKISEHRSKQLDATIGKSRACYCGEITGRYRQHRVFADTPTEATEKARLWIDSLTGDAARVPIQPQDAMQTVGLHNAVRQLRQLAAIALSLEPDDLEILLWLSDISHDEQESMASAIEQQFDIPLPQAKKIVYRWLEAGYVDFTWPQRKVFLTEKALQITNVIKNF